MSERERSPWFFLWGWLPAALAGGAVAATPSAQLLFVTLFGIAAASYWLLLSFKTARHHGLLGLGVAYAYPFLWVGIGALAKMGNFPLWAPLGCVSVVALGGWLTRCRGASLLFTVVLALSCVGLSLPGGWEPTLGLEAAAMGLGTGLGLSFLARRERTRTP